MKLLVTNDDGVDSPGLWALAEALRQDGHEVVVVAPAEERSGSGAAIGYIVHGQGTSASPVEREGWEKDAWALDGAPALCVLLALRHVAFGEGFQAVVSGINPGWNTGRGVLHSGTVGAILTGANAGLPGVAVSIDAATAQVGEVGLHRGVRERWGTAAALAAGAVGWLSTLPPPAEGEVATMLNLNVPNLPLGELSGVRTATLGRPTSSALRPAQPEPGPDGSVRVELGPPAIDLAPGSDNALLLEGFATVTILSGIGEVRGPGGELVEALASVVDGEVTSR
ncbi:MAG: 5'/3'-nucleotidase SurE [Acidimicrobiales bacterium]